MINRKRIRKTEEAGDVDITPLLDIVFILLIFFIVTAVFVDEDGVNPNLPTPNPDKPDTVPPPSKLLYVMENGLVQVDGARLVNPKSVKPIVDEFLASEPDGVVQITAAPDSESGVAVTVLDQATLAARSYKATDRITISKADE
ncbi:MAG: ExbD/TolR family protein [bacterium]